MTVFKSFFSVPFKEKLLNVVVASYASTIDIKVAMPTLDVLF